MRKTIAAVLAIVLLMAIPTLASAQEPARYNFASAQLDTYIKASVGGQGTGRIALYNIDGNRISHITLEASQVPEGWQVEFQPPLADAQVEEGDSTVTVTQNLQVEPSTPLSQAAADVPDGMACVNIGQRGYVLANVATVIVHVPPSAEVGTKDQVVVSATAQWLGQGGAAAMSQNRDFQFSVEVAPAEASADTAGHASNLWRWTPAIIGIVIVAGLAIFLGTRVARRKHA